MGKKIGKRLRSIPAAIWIIFFSLLMELTVFQYDFWRSINNEGEHISSRVTTEATGVFDGRARYVVEEKPMVVEIGLADKFMAYPPIPDFHDVKINITTQDADTGETLPLTTVQLYASDEGSNDPYVFSPFRDILPDVEESQYFRLHTNGLCTKLVLNIYAEPGDIVYIKGITKNPPMPMKISWLRILLMILSGCFFFYAFPKRGLYGININRRSRIQKGITTAVLILQIGLFIGATCLNRSYREPEWEHHKQYHELAVALSKGQLFLEELPPDALNAVPNPYDFSMREKNMEREGASYRWDTAYYNNKYYVYFGVIPVMVFYLPWYLITGTAFPTWLGIAATGVVFVLAAFCLSLHVAERYFKNQIPYLTWLLTTLLMINGGGILMIMRRPDFYSLPILMAVTLSILGIDFWITSLKEDGVSTWRLAAGCLCMALVAGCRPQLAIGSFLIFPIYWDAVFKKRQLFSKNSKLKTGLAIAAYAVVAACLMIYNQRRFGSPFDFGANYNLTTNDMTKRVFEWGRIPVAVFRFLLQPPSIGARFPFVESTSDWTSYVGQSISEPTFGGLLPVSLLVVAALFILGKRRWFPQKNIWVISLMSAAFGLIIACADAQAAGILLRYFSDFGWLFYLSALFCWFTAWQRNGGIRERAVCLCYFQNAAFMVGMAFWLLLLFTDGSNKLSEADPVRFYEFFYQLAFWT